MHPELVYTASHKLCVAIPRLIYDALCFNELPVSWKRVTRIQNKLVHRGEVPEFLEDYCLVLLAQHEVKTKLPNGYEEWVKKS